MIKEINHTVNGIEYVFDETATDWEKDAIREYGVTSFDEIESALT